MLKLRKMLTHRKRVERGIGQLIQEELSDFYVYKPIHYMFDAGGKFIRSILTILSCEAVRENYDKILPGASGIESRVITICLPTFCNSLPAF
jgi:geranylgeranyl pyrophosphate synthase